MRGSFYIFALALCCNACPPGRYGQNCEFRCNCLRNDIDCGSYGCTNEKCGYGFSDPPKCQKRCPRERFGINCMFSCNCPTNDTCDIVNGLCSSNKCKEGFGGAGCQKKVPFLSNPPTVNVIQESEMLVMWKSWTHNSQYKIAQTLQYTIQTTKKTEGNSTSEWLSMADIREGNESGIKAWIIEQMETYIVVMVSHGCPDHRICVLFKNPWFEMQYKFRIALSLLRLGRPSVMLEPGPVTPKWHSIPCRAPSASPRSVIVNNANISDVAGLFIRWEPQSQKSINCFSFWGHEVAFVCQDCLVMEDNANFLASYNITWPENTLLVRNLPQSVLTSMHSIEVMIRSINIRGFPGPWSDPVPCLPILQSTASTKSISFHMTQSGSLPMAFTPPSPKTLLNPNFTSRKAPSKQPLDLHLKLLRRNETHLVISLEGGRTKNCQVDLQVNITTHKLDEANVPQNRIPTQSGVKVAMKDEGDDLTMTLGPLQERMYHRINVSCHSHLTDVTVATGFRRPPKPGSVEVLSSASSTVDIRLPSMDNKLKSRRSLKFTDGERITRKYLVLVERINETWCCPLRHFIENEQITEWDGRVVEEHHTTLDLLFPNFATAEMYRKSYYVAAELFGGVKRFRKSVGSRIYGTTVMFTVGDGASYGLYDNPPLSPDRTYVIWFAVEDALDGLIRRSFSRSPDITLHGFATHEAYVVSVTTVAVGIVTLLLFIALGAFVVGWVVRRRNESRLWKRLYRAKLQSCAYLDKEGYHLGRDSILLELAASPLLENFLSPPSQTSDMFIFPPPSLAFTQGLWDGLEAPIPVKDLRSFCDLSISTSLSSSRETSAFTMTEFNSLPSGFTDVIAASCRPDIACPTDPSNHCVVLPYDRNSVKVKKGSVEPELCKTLPADLTSAKAEEEIHTNASRVRTLGRGTCIVAQTPTVFACCVLWQIVEQESITHIIDLDPPEATVQASAQSLSSSMSSYWPQVKGQRTIYCGMEVKLISETNMAHYTFRIFWVGRGNKGRFVHQWNYHAWSSQSIPAHHISFLDFVQNLRDEVSLGRECTITSACRALVHSNWGDGRDGVFLAVDSLLVQGNKLNIVDIKSCVVLLRSERHNLIKTPVQYAFIYECLAEQFDHSCSRKSLLRFLTCLRLVSAGEKPRIPPEVAYEHKLMLACSYTPLKVEGPRFDGFVTCDPSVQVGLEPNRPRRVFVDGFQCRKTFLVQRSAISFDDDELWKDVVEQGVETIVMLQRMIVVKRDEERLEEQEDQCLHLPLSMSLRMGDFRVTCLSAERMEKPECSVFQLLVIQPSSVPLTSLSEGSHIQGCSDSYGLKVEVIQVESRWGESYAESLCSLQSFVEFFHLLRTNQSWQHPMMILENDKKTQRKEKMEGETLIKSGLDKTGMLLGVWLCVEQASARGLVDVLSACRFLRSFLPRALVSKEEYYLTCLAVGSYLRHHSDSFNSALQDGRSDLHRFENLVDVRTSLGKSQKSKKILSSFPKMASSYRMFSRFGGKRRSGVTKIGRDFDGSYQKFASPSASPYLWSRGSSLARRRVELSRRSETRKFGFKSSARRFFDSLVENDSKSS